MRMTGEFRVAHFIRKETTDGQRLVLEEFHFDARRLLHRDPEEGPAYLIRYPSGPLCEVEYHWHGLLHRESGPARTRYLENGAIYNMQWWRFGRCHRDPLEGPAYQVEIYPSAGRAEQITYFVHDYMFRDPREGPMSYGLSDGKIIHEIYANEIPPRPKPSLAWLRKTYGENRMGAMD